MCGCCLNRAAAAHLDDAGLGDLLRRVAARRVETVDLHAGGRTARLRVPAMAVVSRRALDAALVDAAVSAGACFRSRTSATLGAVRRSVNAAKNTCRK